MDCRLANRGGESGTNSGRRGITLLEMVLALFLFAIIVPLFAGIWPIHKRAVSQSHAAVCGNHICRKVLEDSISAGYDGVDALEAAPLADRTIQLVTEREDNDGNVTTQSQTFVWTLDVRTPAEEPTLLTGEKLVVAEVDWTEQGEPRKYSMNTILAENP